MNHKMVFRTFSVIFILAGAFFFATGPYLLSFFGVKEFPEIVSRNGETLDFWEMYAFVRMFGSAVLMYGLLIGFLAYIDGVKNRKYASFGAALGQLAFLIIYLSQQISIWNTAAGWVIAAVFLLALVSFSYLAFKKEAMD